MIAIHVSDTVWFVLKKVNWTKSELPMIDQVKNNLDLPRGGNQSVRQIHAMYATRLMTEIYHLVQPGGQHTLCGLRVSRVTSERKTNTLQLVSELQNNLTICKHCERIRAQDYQDLENRPR